VVVILDTKLSWMSHTLDTLAFMFAHNGSKRLGSGVVMLVQHLASNEAVLGDTLIQTTH
jgi:hypothetical protein